MDDEVECSIVASLLQFYSDRAIANASFLVASIFGLFVVLSLMSGGLEALPLDTWVYLALTYWFLWAFGLYSLLNFGHYAQNAQVAKDKIKYRKDINLETDIMKEAKKNQVQWFFDLKRGGDELKKRPLLRVLKAAKTVFLLPSYFLFIGIFPFVAVNRAFWILIPVAVITTIVYLWHRVREYKKQLKEQEVE